MNDYLSIRYHSSSFFLFLFLLAYYSNWVCWNSRRYTHSNPFLYRFSLSFNSSHKKLSITYYRYLFIWHYTNLWAYYCVSKPLTIFCLYSARLIRLDFLFFCFWWGGGLYISGFSRIFMFLGGNIINKYFRNICL